MTIPIVEKHVDTNTNSEASEKEPLRENEEKTDVTALENWCENMKKRLSDIKSNITVEPIVASVVMASVLSRIATLNLNLDKACRVNKDFGDDICDALMSRTRSSNYTQYEKEVQQLVASIDAWKSIIQTAIPSVLILFIGAWSDRTGNRKLCILLPILGEFLTIMSNILNAYFFYEIPVQVTMMLEALFPAMCGGFVTILLGVFSYVSDITNEKTRTFRVGMVNLCMVAGVPLGTSLSGILLNLLGYYGVFSLSASIYFMSFFYGFFKLKNHSKEIHQDLNNEKQKPVEKKSLIKSVKMFLDLTNVKQTIAVLFKKRPDRKQIKLILCLSVVSIVYGPMHGEQNLNYMYTRFRFGWDAVTYSMYHTFSIVAHSMGSLFTLSLFNKRLKFDDSTLGIISIASKFAGSLLTAFSKTTISMFMVPVVEILNSTMFTSLRSMASKLVDKEEMGKVNSLLSLVETLTAVLFDPLYSLVYMASLPEIPGAVFFMSAAMTIPAGAILIWFFAQHRKEVQKQKQTAQEDNEKQ